MELWFTPRQCATRSHAANYFISAAVESSMPHSPLIEKRVLFGKGECKGGKNPYCFLRNPLWEKILLGGNTWSKSHEEHVNFVSSRVNPWGFSSFQT